MQLASGGLCAVTWAVNAKSHDEPHLARDYCWLGAPAVVPLGAMRSTQYIGWTFALRVATRQLAAAFALAVALPAAAQTCIGDIVADGRVDGGDLGVLLSNWGVVVATSPVSRACDVDNNGQVTGADLGLVLADWGYCPVTIADVSPTQGCLLGGTEITITGIWLGQTSAVTIGGVPATGVTPISSTVVKATVPVGVIGPAAIAITTPSGTSIASQTFTYMPASVSSITPNEGAIGGGTLITITGDYLGLTTAVIIGGTPSSNLTIVNATTVTAVTPSGMAGNADVVIIGKKGTVVAPGGFTYRSIITPSWASLLQAIPDAAVVTDPALRAAISATGYAWRVRDIGTQIEMVLVPPGTFQMGCIMGSNQFECSSFEYPVHTVSLTNAFYLGRYEITQGQWTARMGSNPSYFQASNGFPGPAERPVEAVSWSMAQAFVSTTGMRLPTEAEWEYACRAGTQTPFHSGPGFPNGTTDDNLANMIAWLRPFGCTPCPGSAPVGSFAANALGCHDMLGNVSEWVNDGVGAYPSDPQTNPTGELSGANRVHRGGSFAGSSGAARASFRRGLDAGGWYSDLGFRVVRNP